MKTITLNNLKKLLGEFVSVKNAPSRNGMNEAPNQFILTYKNGEVLQSYESLIGAKIGDTTYLTDHHDYSVTTGRFCGAWCGKNARERRKSLENGEFVFVTK